MIVALGVVSVGAVGCPGNGGPDGGYVPAGDAAPAPTTAAPANAAPVIAAEPFASAVGERLEARVAVSDPDGEVVEVAWRRTPPGFVESGAGGGGVAGTSFSWTPPVAGTWRAELAATDDAGATATAEVTFVARHPHRPSVLVSLGDSVAAGFGLDPADALLGDPCWRAPRAAYPRRVMERLEAAGDVRRGEGQVVLAACAGTSAGDVWEAPTWRPPGAPRGVGEQGWSQLDWAVHLNPGYVTLTVGANDVGVVDLSILDGGELDRAELDRRLETVAGGVGYLLDELVHRTDAVVALTTYHNPTAGNPTGRPGCRGACFVEIAGTVHDALNRTLAQAARRHGPRVRLVDVAPLFRGHEAGDAFGPDWLREPIETILGVQVRAYCSADDPGGSWISSFDCIHPNRDGIDAVAGAVAAALSSSPPEG